MASGTPVWSTALHLFEGVGEQGVEWFMMQARLLRASATPAAASSLAFEVLPAFDFMSAEYAELFQRADATAFQHPLWLDRAFRRLTDATNRAPAVLVGRLQSDRRLVFVLPMVRRGPGPFALLDAADLEVGDYNAFVVDRTVARNPVAVQQIQRMLSQFNLVRVRKVRDDTSFLWNSPARVSAMDFMAHEVALAAVPVEGWQSQLLKPDFARFLRSKRKRLAAKGTITFEATCDPAAIRRAFESMRRFRQARWTDDLLADPRHFEFYLDIALSGHAGFARTYVLSVGDRILSVLFGIRHAGRFCFLLMGFDNQNFRNHSTGLLALESAIEHSIRHGDQVFDLTIGDEGYKQDFATRSVPMSVLWFGRKPLTLLAPVALAAAKRAISPFRKSPRRRTR